MRSVNPLRVVDSKERERTLSLKEREGHQLPRPVPRSGDTGATNGVCVLDFAVNCGKENLPPPAVVHFQAAFHFDKLTKVKFPIGENDPDLVGFGGLCPLGVHTVTTAINQTARTLSPLRRAAAPALSQTLHYSRERG